ncbi:hypothetical protein [Neorhizobium sp. SHOUNA12B]|uniref:hypothetical protein n=1 Tax=Neorhizobium sp. SHOUNA12B TaxID=2908928 RepID=UPI0025D60464|nr:hypothetical protein [Neorhizobium sp. SHOUNA12B]MCJ9674763.1 hypothetical protein [Neorhizobium sp. SHOUNA12B]
MPLLFLMRLQHVQLPVHVVCPEEIRCVSVLAATGLVEAEIAPRMPAAPYAPSRLATVLRITESGLAEIVKMGEVPELVKRSMQITRRFRLM